MYILSRLKNPLRFHGWGALLEKSKLIDITNIPARQQVQTCSKTNEEKALRQLFGLQTISELYNN